MKPNVLDKVLYAQLINDALGGVQRALSYYGNSGYDAVVLGEIVNDLQSILIAEQSAASERATGMKPIPWDELAFFGGAYYYQGEDGVWHIYTDKPGTVAATASCEWYYQAEDGVWYICADKPVASCECGAHKIGVENGKAGHSSWCPVKAI